ncbi:MAG TPA: hypothetical protein VMR34_00715 [Candidatus Saccharimonadales bacterium]|nr:hypothetical protein [Candidatus Saccharimonadales bacterium]
MLKHKLKISLNIVFLTGLVAMGFFLFLGNHKVLGDTPVQTPVGVPSNYEEFFIHLNPSTVSGSGVTVIATRQAAPSPGPDGGNSTGTLSVSGNQVTTQQVTPTCPPKQEGHCNETPVTEPLTNTYEIIVTGDDRTFYEATSGSGTAAGSLAACTDTPQNDWTFSVVDSSGFTIGQVGPYYVPCYPGEPSDSQEWGSPTFSNSNADENYTPPSISVYQNCGHGYGTLPSGLTATVAAEYNYNCPNGGSVQNGAYTLASLTAPGPPSGTPSSAQAESGPALNCVVDFNPLTWLFCPIVDTASKLIGTLDSAIVGMLDINGCQYFNGTIAGSQNPNCAGQSNTPAQQAGSNGFYKAWESLRTLAIAIVVIAALVMVISQALGYEAFDAYTIKKVLPRMLIAVIGISLSWQIIQVLIQVSDGLGQGIRALIYTPFTSIGTIQIGQTGSTALVLLSAASLVGLSLIGILSIVLTAAIAVILAFVLLTFREILVVFLAIFAPIAIAMYILPGTQRVWKLWWENLSKALLMFPIISGIIAIGRVFAAVTTSGGNTGLVQEMVAIIAYFGPYFMIPFTFKWAGGLLSATGSLATHLQRAANKPLNNFRKRKLAENWGKMKRENRYPGAKIPGINKFKRGQRFNERYNRGLNAGLAYVTQPSALLPGKHALKGRSALSTGMAGSINEAAKTLQQEGLLDDGSGNEFINHGGTLGSLQNRVKELRDAGETDKADGLAMYAKYAGRKDMILGAMKVNASFGKLSGASLEKLNDMYGTSQQDRSAKAAAWGDLIFTSKNAGNYITYTSELKNNVVSSYQTLYDKKPTDARQRLGANLARGGPSVTNSLKPYTEYRKDGTSFDAVAESMEGIAERVGNVKANATAEGQRVAQQIVAAAANQPPAVQAQAQQEAQDQVVIINQRADRERRASLEQLAMTYAPGAYTDPKTKQFAEEAVNRIMGLAKEIEDYQKENLRGRGGQFTDQNIASGTGQPQGPPTEPPA